MASQVNRDFFKKAKKVDRAIEIRDNEAVIPAVKDKAEVRARLPNRRMLTIDERKQRIEQGRAELASLEEEIEVERKALLEAVKSYEASNYGAAEVVAQNLKVKTLMEKRSRLSRPETWIETLGGLSLKDVFSSKRDNRKIGDDVFQIKRRVEPLTSLYVDLEEAAASAEAAATSATSAATSAATTKTKKPTVLGSLGTALEGVLGTTAAATAVAKPEEVAQGVIIGQRRVIKTKKTSTAAAPAGAVSFSL
jgi:hypothetical protein